MEKTLYFSGKFVFFKKFCRSHEKLQISKRKSKFSEKTITFTEKTFKKH